MMQQRTLSIGSDRTHTSQPLSLKRAFTRVADSALALDRLSEFYRAIPAAESTAQFVDLAIERLEVRTRIIGVDLKSIPASGPAVVLANHPFGGLDGLLLAQLLLRRRPDVRILTNRFLSHIPELSELFISLDVFNGRSGIRENVGNVRKALRWVASGGMLAMFPAGEVSHLKIDAGGIIDPVWPDSAARIVRMSGAPVTPIYFGGRNSWIFQLAGLVHPLLRTALLPRELLNKARREVTICIGKPIEPARVAGIEKNDVLASHLRLQVYALGNDANSSDKSALRTHGDAVCDAIDPALLEAQIAALPDEQILSRNAELTVFVASRQQTPDVIAEIGRLRELTFRTVGEGTGRATDLDHFDDYYQHLFIWNAAKREVAGAYRIGRSDEILRVSGLGGLYTHELFRFSREFFDQLPPALELGRSFVRPEYQRSFAPLLLLWKAIAAYVVRHPQYAILFGAVSISDDYHPLSKEFLREYLTREHFAGHLARCVRPRNRLRRRMTLKTLIHPWSGPKSLDSLSELVSTLESDGKGIPVLLRQYLKLGGKIVGFNVDPEFSNAIDCLLVVNLCATETRVLEKYMGKTEAAQFLREHRTATPDLLTA